MCSTPPSGATSGFSAFGRDGLRVRLRSVDAPAALGVEMNANGVESWPEVGALLI